MAISICLTDYSTKQIQVNNNRRERDMERHLLQKISQLEKEKEFLVNEKKYMKRNKLIVETADCELCCETVPVDNLYKSGCACKYKYCKPCHEKLPRVYNNEHQLVRRCPTCRSVAL